MATTHPTRSPFPGMDPHLEAYWLDVHSSLAAEARRALNRVLPDDLRAEMEERTVVGERPADPPADRRAVHPDVTVRRRRSGSTGATALLDATTPAVGGTVVLRPPEGSAVQRSVVIRAVEGRRPVTAIEFVSPFNKVGRGLRQYRRKREQLLDRGVNVVEVDLVRAGNWQRLLAPFEVAPSHRTPYRVTIHLPAEADRAFLVPVPLRGRLPAPAVPLRPGDPEVRLDLQALLDETYATGRYAGEIDYARPPVPPLDEDDAAWAASLLGRDRG